MASDAPDQRPQAGEDLFTLAPGALAALDPGVRRQVEILADHAAVVTRALRLIETGRHR